MSLFHPLRVAGLRRDTADSVVIGLEVPEALRERFRFEPGQFVTLQRGSGIEAASRPYSICAAPGEPLRVGVRRVPRGLFSPLLHGAVREGDTLHVMPPQGRFGAVLARRTPRHALLVAAGSGITPVLSILRTLLEQRAPAACTLLYGNRTPATSMFAAELQALQQRHAGRLAIHWLFSRDAGVPAAQAGRPDGPRVAALLQALGGAQAVDEAFVCGPQAMNDEVVAVLRAAGLPAAHLHTERFALPATLAPGLEAPQPQPGDADEAQLSIVQDGQAREVTFHAGHASVLEAAEAAGLALPHACRSGICASCRATLLEGQVRMAHNFALDPADLGAGQVLTCQARPLTPRVVLSLDAG
jgi:ring-1,2-phenylacetyl-CoA epoxidase subunit PaaE